MAPKPPIRRLALAAAASALCLAVAGPALAWMETGHRTVTRLAVEALPPELPAFLKTPANLFKLAELGREPDRSRLSGEPHDTDLDPGHESLADDQGRLSGGPSLEALPPDRGAYEQALQAAGTSSWKVGWLPYNIADGWQQLAKDFAYWRIDKLGEKAARTAVQRAWFAKDRALREELTVRDLGYWSHFVADGSQPMHASIHYDGWGNFPNPRSFTQDHIHLPFEGAFVHDNVAAAVVKAAMPPYRACDCTPLQAAGRYLATSRAQIVPLFELWAAGGFKDHDPRGTAFAVERLAAGAAELRDLIIDAWRASADQQIAFSGKTVKQIEASGVVPYDDIYGRD